MTSLHIIAASLLTGASAACLAYGALAFAGESPAQNRQAPLIEPRALRKALRRQGPAAYSMTQSRLMAWAGYGYGPKALGCICIGSGIASWLLCVWNGLPETLALFAAGIFTFAPYAWVRSRITRKMRQAAESIAATVETLASASQAGLDLKTAFLLALEAAPANAQNLLAPVKRSFLLDRPVQASMQTLCEAVPLPAAHMLAATVTVHAVYGGSMTACLTALSQALQEEKRLQRRLKTASAEAESTAAMLLLMTLMSLAGMAAFAPETAAMLTGTPLGQSVLTLALSSVLTGYFVIKRLTATALGSARDNF